MLFNSWGSLSRVAIVGVLAYLALLLLLRVSGKRTLSKMNAFDMVVTVAIGSTLASALLDRNVALLDGILSFSVLIGLQFVITWLSVRSRRVSWMVKSEPALLFYQGAFLQGAMKRERVVKDELLAAVREQGVESLADVEAIIFETQGTLSVVRGSRGEAPTSIQNVKGVPGA